EGKAGGLPLTFHPPHPHINIQAASIALRPLPHYLGPTAWSPRRTASRTPLRPHPRIWALRRLSHRIRTGTDHATRRAARLLRPSRLAGARPGSVSIRPIAARSVAVRPVTARPIAARPFVARPVSRRSGGRNAWRPLPTSW